MNEEDATTQDDAFLERTRKPTKTVITYGTFDLFHIGHLNLLRRLGELGDRLCVGVSTDEFNASKGKRTFIRFEDRLDIVRSLKFVDIAFAEEDWEQKPRDITKYGASILGMGDDWSGKFDALGHLCEVVYLPRTEGVSSTEIKTALKQVDKQHIKELQDALGLVSSLVERLS